MSFIPDTWADDPAGNTPITAAKLTNIETGISQSYTSWTSYTPTVSGVTQGNGTVVGRYKQIGKTVLGMIQYTLGSTSTMVGVANFTIPPLGSPLNSSGGRPAQVLLLDTGNNTWLGLGTVGASSITVTYIGTNGVANAFSATTPLTWSTGDQINVNFFYEIA